MGDAGDLPKMGALFQIPDIALTRPPPPLAPHLLFSPA